jgi:hypothetical protein
MRPAPSTPTTSMRAQRTRCAHMDLPSCNTRRMAEVGGRGLTELADAAAKR